MTMPASIKVTAASTPSSIGWSGSPEWDEACERAAADRRNDEARTAHLRRLDDEGRRSRCLIHALADGFAVPTVVTITAGDHVGAVAMSPQRAELLAATVRSLLGEVFTSGWLDGTYTHEDGTTVAERSLVVVGVTGLPLWALKLALGSVAEQFEQEALGLMVAHGGGLDSLVGTDVTV